MSKIYTKTGDAGGTSLLGGGRVTKDCIALRVIGEVDELNSLLGEAVAHLYGEEPSEFIQDIQRDLFKVGAEVASLQDKKINGTIKKVEKEEIKKLEERIDQYWAGLPELKNFILPGGSVAGSIIHHSRAICRRAERELVAMGKDIKIRSELYMYLNRLSDYLFATARWVNYKEGVEEIVV